MAEEVRNENWEIVSVILHLTYFGILGGGGEGGTYGDEFVGNDLHADQLAHQQDVIAVPIDAEKEGDGVEEISQDEFDGEVVLLERIEGADIQIMPPPRQHRINDPQQTQNAQQTRDNHARDLQAQPPAVRERVQRVGGTLFVFHCRDDDAPRRERLLGLGVAQLGDGEGGGDGHDAAGD